MLDPNQVPPVVPEEYLARFVLFSRHFRSSDNTVKLEAFMPHPLIELSLTRHVEATREELWQEGQRVAGLRKATHYGRADVMSLIIIEAGLDVEAKPILENPNHADVTGWPSDKPAQKMIALEIAIKSKFVPKPT